MIVVDKHWTGANITNRNKVKSIMVINTEGVHNLRMAIILQAVRDYKSAIKGRHLAGIKPDVMRYRCEDFFSVGLVYAII